MSAPILMVNGCREVRRENREVLERAGYQVLEALSSDQAVAVARREVPRIVLIEAAGAADLPLKLVRRLRRHPRTAHIPILVLSAEAALLDEEELYRLGGVECVHELLQPHWLLEELQYLTLHPDTVREAAPQAD